MTPLPCASSAAFGKPARALGLFLVVGVIIITTTGPAHSRQVAEELAPPPLAATAGGGTESYIAGLEVFLNGEATDQVFEVVIDANGRPSKMRARDLRAMRITTERSIPDDNFVSLTDIQGLDATYDRPLQAIRIRVGNALRKSLDINVTEDMTADPAAISGTAGFLLNYDLYGSLGSGSFFNGQAEARLFSGLGTLSVTMVGRTKSPGQTQGNLKRLESTWRYLDPVSNRSFLVGDLTTSAPSWASSYRLGGIQIQTAFAVRPDIITAALPQFGGTAEVPSTVELFVNDSKIYSGQVPSGPFSLQRLPQITGGDIRLVTRDSRGNERAIRGAFYYSPSLLRSGLLDYSIEIGALRYNYGEESLDYGKLAGVASARFGLTDNRTIEAHGEVSEHFFNGGLGLNQRLGGIGVLQVSGSFSAFNGTSGGRFSVGVSTQIGPLSAQASTERRSETYFDLGRFSVMQRLQQQSPLDVAAVNYPATLRIDRFSFSFPLPFDQKANVSFNYTDYRTAATKTRLLNASLSRYLGYGFSVWVNGFHDLGRKSSNINLGIVRSFGGANVLASAQRVDGRTNFELQATGASNQRQNSFNWSFTNRQGPSGASFRSATVGYRFPEAWLQTSVQQAGNQTRVTGQATGSIVAMAGGIVAANRVGDSFVLIRNAGPGTVIRQNAVAIAKSDRSGNALLPDTMPFLPTRIELDPTNLPIGWQVDKTERVVVTGWRSGAVVDFGARKQTSALVRIETERGGPITPGSIMRLENGMEVIVGYGGEAWIEAAQEHMRGTIDLGRGRVCRISLELPKSLDPLPMYGPFKCVTLPAGPSE